MFDFAKNFYSLKLFISDHSDVVTCKIILLCFRRDIIAVWLRAAILFDGRSTKAKKFFFKFHM